MQDARYKAQGTQTYSTVSPRVWVGGLVSCIWVGGRVSASCIRRGGWSEDVVPALFAQRFDHIFDLLSLLPGHHQHRVGCGDDDQIIDAND